MSSPINHHPPILQPIRINHLENGRANIDILKPTPLARINNGGLRRGISGWVVDVDRGAAEGVGVWVGGVVHHLDGEGDDGVGVLGGVAAGAEAWVRMSE